MEKTLLGMSEAWAAYYKDFEASGKKKLPPPHLKVEELLQMQSVLGLCCCSSRSNCISITNVFSATVRQHNLVPSLEKASCCFARRPVYLLLKI